ncbi:hypothetical protein [Acidovorax sp. LjRoot129]|uniref:hypothetical protein n=1 Tax=Acidovorax sp. LjRoot129 TaxID=3342260 RepID=UPI003F50913D
MNISSIKTMTLKKFFLASMSVLGIGTAATAASPVSTMSSKAINFTLPTVAADELQFEIPTGKTFEGAPQFHEDEWRQVEFYPVARLAEIQKRLKEFKAFEKDNRIQYGWKNIYARKIASAPVLGTAGSTELSGLMQRPIKPAPILTTSSAPIGQVKDGFTIRVAESVFLYGIANASSVTSLAAMVERGGDDLALTSAFTRINEKYKVMLVDWRGQMLLTGAGPDGGIQVWRP